MTPFQVASKVHPMGKGQRNSSPCVPQTEILLTSYPVYWHNIFSWTFSQTKINLDYYCCTDLSVLFCFCSLAHKEKWSVETNVIKTWTCYWILPGIRTDCMITVEEDW